MCLLSLAACSGGDGSNFNPTTGTTTLTDCAANAEVTHWKLVDGPHIPFPRIGSALDMMVDWIVDHRRT